MRWLTLNVCYITVHIVKYYILAVLLMCSDWGWPATSTSLKRFNRTKPQSPKWCVIRNIPACSATCDEVTFFVSCPLNDTWTLVPLWKIMDFYKGTWHDLLCLNNVATDVVTQCPIMQHSAATGREMKALKRRGPWSHLYIYLFVLQHLLQLHQAVFEGVQFECELLRPAFGLSPTLQQQALTVDGQLW